MKFTPFLNRFRRSRSGSIIIMTAVSLPVALLLCGLVLDEAMLNIERRKMQKAVDMAAIAGASNLENAESIALATLSDNGIATADSEILLKEDWPETLPDITTIRIQKGRYEADASLTVVQRFTVGEQPYNALKVSTRRRGDLHFTAYNRTPPVIERTAIAAMNPEVTFAAGTRLAALNGGLANDILGGLTGTELSLSVMDYEALADADIDLPDFLSNLADEAGVTAVTYEDILQTDVTLADIATALSTTGSTTTASSALSRLDNDMNGASQTIRPEKFISIGRYAGQKMGASTPTLTASALDIAQAAVSLASVGRQVDIDVDLGLDGVTSSSLRLVIGEPMQYSGWLANGSTGHVIRTAQMRARLLVELVDGDLPTGAVVRLPVYLSAAYGEAAVSSLSCTPRQTTGRSASIAAHPGVASVAIGETTLSDMADFSTQMNLSPAEIIELPLVSVTASANTWMQDQNPTYLTFSNTDITNRNVRTAAVNQYTQSLFSSALDNLSVSVDAAGLELGLPSGLNDTVADLLDDIAPSLDSAINEVLDAVGLSLGEIDVQVLDVRCPVASLVQ